jgi:hypothetical protein
VEDADWQVFGLVDPGLAAHLPIAFRSEGRRTT